MADQEVTKLDDLEYKWVDGYKHRSILADIGWDYSLRDGYTTNAQDVITLTNTLEECLVYKNIGIPNLVDYLIGEIDGTTQLAEIAGTEQFNLIYKGITRFFEDVPINHLGDVYMYKKMLDDVESGSFGYIVEFIELQINDRVEFINSLGDEVEGFRYYYEGRGFNYLGVLQPGDSYYYLDDFENDSRGYIYTEDKDKMDELYTIRDMLNYLESKVPGLRDDLPKSIINTKYSYLLSTGNEEELQRVLDYLVEKEKRSDIVTEMREIIPVAESYKRGLHGEWVEYDIDDYYESGND